MVSLDTNKVEHLFRKNMFYIDPKVELDREKRLDKFKKFLKTELDIASPIVVIEEENNNPKISFIDGRHRFCYLRDMGMKKIPFTMDEKSRVIARKHKLII